MSLELIDTFATLGTFIVIAATAGAHSCNCGTLEAVT